MRLGAPVFTDQKDFEEQALAHKAKGCRAAYCPQGLSLNDSGGIAAAAGEYLRFLKALDREGAGFTWTSPLPSKPFGFWARFGLNRKK